MVTPKRTANTENTFISMTTLEIHFTNALQIQKTHATSETLQSQPQHNGSEPKHNGNVKEDGISMMESH